MVRNYIPQLDRHQVKCPRCKKPISASKHHPDVIICAGCRHQFVESPR